jgi:cell division protein FtsN
MKYINIKKNSTHKIKLSLISLSLISLSLLLTACSQVSGLLKSDNESMNKDAALVIPPTLRLPKAELGVSQTAKSVIRMANISNEVIDNKDYYVVVGTYPNQEQALDTFVRLSSIGLPHATMESRKTKAGSMLHMVRLGPFHKQSAIDQVKDKLVSDGLSQFKVVIN